MNCLETAWIPCPYCGERVEILIDSSITDQEYTEDCPVCCRPIELQVRVAGSGAPTVITRREDD